MKKNHTSLFTLMASFILALSASCPRENVENDLSASGYWRGNAYIFHTAVLNRADGSARIYFRIFGMDTANATKADGFYSVTGNSYKVSGIHKRADPNYDIRDTFFIEANLESSNLMNGQLYTSLSPEIVDCTLRKQ